MRRRVLWGLLAVLAVTGVLLVVPVLTRGHAQPVPVTPTTDVVAMGSVTAPAASVQVKEGLSTPAQGVAATAPVLTLTRTGVHTFSAVGVSWKEDPAVTDTLVHLRVQDGTGAWGSWSTVGTESEEAGVGPVRPGVRGGTDPFWTGPSTGVQVELVTRSGAQPTDVKLDLIDPGSSDADADTGSAAATSTAHGAVTMPQVFSRAQWGADERLMTWDPEYGSTIKAAALHHTDDTNNYTADQVPAMIRAIYAFHALDSGRGWGDIGYNALVDKFGRLWEGRAGGLASTVIGAHTGGFNTNTFGISMIGNYDQVDTPPAMIGAVESFIGWKFSLYGVNPTATVGLVSGGGGTDKWPVGQTVTLPTIFGHRDTGSTACPGSYGYAKLPAIRSAVASIVARTPSIASRYNGEAGLRGLLGAPSGSPTVVNGVATSQVYAGGTMFDAPGGTAHEVHGYIRDHYLALGGPAALGVPTTDESGTPDGVGRYNHFALGASVYWTPGTGPQAVKGDIRTLWGQQGWERGPLGYPTSDELAGPNGSRSSTFQHGTIVWTAAGGAHSLTGATNDAWTQLGGAGWSLPVTNTTATPDHLGTYTHFANGSSIYWTQANGAVLVQGPIRTLWSQQGWERGPLGYPTAPEQDAGNGIRTQDFQHGTVVWTQAGGARSVSGEIAVAWQALGGLGWAAGLPTTSTTVTPDGVGRFNHFADGSSIYWTPATEAQVVTPAATVAWSRQGWERGPLGYPTAPEQDAGNGIRTQTFQHGTVVRTGATDAKALTGAVNDKWLELHGPAWSAGLPVTDTLTAPDGVGRFTGFTDGSSIYWTPTTGAHVVGPGARTVWGGTGWEHGPLGYPTVDDSPGPDHTTHVDVFQHGVVVWTPSGSWVLRDAVAKKWVDLGGLGWTGALPVTGTLTTPDGVGRYTHFADGSSIYWSPATLAHAVTPATRTAWAALGWERGALGYPVSDQTPVSGSTTAKSTTFQHGVVYDGGTLGVHAVYGYIGAEYQRRNGPSSPLGLPIDDEHAVPGGRQSDFQHGSITWNATTGAITVVGG